MSSHLTLLIATYGLIIFFQCLLKTSFMSPLLSRLKTFFRGACHMQIGHHTLKEHKERLWEELGEGSRFIPDRIWMKKRKRQSSRTWIKEAAASMLFMSGNSKSGTQVFKAPISFTLFGPYFLSGHSFYFNWKYSSLNMTGFLLSLLNI